MGQKMGKIEGSPVVRGSKETGELLSLETCDLFLFSSCGIRYSASHQAVTVVASAQMVPEPQAMRGDFRGQQGILVRGPLAIRSQAIPQEKRVDMRRVGISHVVTSCPRT